MEPLSLSLSLDCVGPRLGKASVFIVTYLRKDYVEWIVCSFSFFFLLFSLSLSLSVSTPSGVFHRWNSANRSNSERRFSLVARGSSLTSSIHIYIYIASYQTLLSRATCISYLIFYLSFSNGFITSITIPRGTINLGEKLERDWPGYFFFHPRKSGRNRVNCGLSQVR